MRPRSRRRLSAPRSCSLVRPPPPGPVPAASDRPARAAGSPASDPVPSPQGREPRAPREPDAPSGRRAEAGTRSRRSRPRRRWRGDRRGCRGPTRSCWHGPGAASRTRSSGPARPASARPPPRRAARSRRRRRAGCRGSARPARARGLEDAAHLLEAAPHAAARAGAVLHQEPGASRRAAVDHLTDRRRHLREHRREAGPQVGPRGGRPPRRARGRRPPPCSGPGSSIEERSSALRGGEVDQVHGVQVSGRAARRPRSCRGRAAAPPASRRSGRHIWAGRGVGLDHLRPDRQPVVDGGVDASPGRPRGLRSAREPTPSRAGPPSQGATSSFTASPMPTAATP